MRLLPTTRPYAKLQEGVGDAMCCGQLGNDSAVCQRHSMARSASPVVRSAEL
jgi:hypothetical protein